MPGIGEYRNKVAILPRVLAVADATGEEVETWPDPSPAQEHWCCIEAPTGFDESDVPRRSHDSLRFRFRTLVTLAAVDRVRLKEFNEVYSIVGIWRERSEQGGWQTVCDLVSAVLT